MLTRLFRTRLRVKVIALTVIVLLLGFTILLLLDLRHKQEILMARHEETARLLAASIAASIETGMQEGRPEIIRRLVDELRKALGDVRHIDVYRRNGVEAFTDLETVHAVDMLAGLPPDVLQRLSKEKRGPGKRLDDPLLTRAVETGKPQEITQTLDGVKVLTFFQPLPNLEPCQVCHGEDHKVRGVVRVSVGLDTLDRTLKASRDRQLLVAGLTILGLAGALVVFMGRVVLAPIARTAATAGRIRDGDLEARVGVRSQDEIGRLGGALNDMAGRLQLARGELEARNAELAATLRSLQESTRKLELLEQVKGALAKFVPEAVTRLLEQHPDARELEKREADVSVLFLDVEGYTRLSEQVPASQLNRMIQDYFGAFLEIIRAHHGDVNETAGDGLMVIFQSEDGGPARHALNAAGAAFQLLGKVAALNREFAGVYPPVAIHIGINSGPALVGATKLDAAGGGRWTFTASGPTTNLAARIAGLTRGGEVKVGPETAARIKAAYVLEDVGEHQLKNVSAPVRVYRLVPAGVYSRVEA
jgi:class 3 adenylate cyclase